MLSEISAVAAIRNELRLALFVSLGLLSGAASAEVIALSYAERVSSGGAQCELTIENIGSALITGVLAEPSSPDFTPLDFGAIEPYGKTARPLAVSSCQDAGLPQTAWHVSFGSSEGDWSIETTPGTLGSQVAIRASVLRAGHESLSSLKLGGFVNTDRIQMNGSAGRVGPVLRLTPASPYRTGSAFYETPIAIDDLSSFHAAFQFQITGGTGGADGLLFMLQNSPQGIYALGKSGRYLGYGGGSRITRSVAVEFDTAKNRDDPNNNHISLLINGQMTPALAVASAGLPDFNNGALINAWVDYEGISDRLDVFVSTGSSPKPPRAVLTYRGLKLETIVGSQAFIGFSAGTGSRVNNHDIRNWSVNAVPSGLVGYWKFEEPDGAAILDSSGTNNDGFLVNATRAAGKIGQALRVIGKDNSHGHIPVSASLNSVQGNATVTAWLRPEGVPDGFEAAVNRQIAETSHPDQIYLGFGKVRSKTDPTIFQTLYKWEITTTENGERVIYSGLPLANRWVHMAGTYDGNVIRMYVNGVQIGGTRPSQGEIVVDANPLTLGAAENGPEGRALGSYYKGLIDEVRIYNRALTPAEIRTIFQQAP